MEGPTLQDHLFHDSSILLDQQTQRPTDQAGILPRIAFYIQKEIKRYEKLHGKSIKFEVSALEIYCENIRDLLSENDNQYLEIKNNKNAIFCPG